MLNKFVITLCLFFFLGFSNVAFAAGSDIYSFDSSKQQLRFQHLNQQFRCLVCQNETLADSNAPLAKDLRFQIYKMVKQDKSDQEVIQYLENRYGDFVLFRPPMSKFTFLLWFGPFLMLTAALARLYWLISRHKKVKPATATYRFSKKDRERIRHLLSEY